MKRPDRRPYTPPSARTLSREERERADMQRWLEEICATVRDEVEMGSESGVIEIHHQDAKVLRLRVSRSRRVGSNSGA